ncbi:MAG: DUF3021 domain-containing protein [Lachnospiraceae bacterium]|nr:DUF3021 domain-containing protein [Lachnospiraceae bacterium]
MKEIFKDLLKSTVISMVIAMVIFCFVCMTFDISNGGITHYENYQFTKMVIGCVLVGLGFGVPSIVYRNDNIPMPIKVVIHMGIGCVVYTLVALAVGWIGGATIIQIAITAVIPLVVAFMIWFAFMVYFRNEAKKMNDRIRAKKG